MSFIVFKRIGKGSYELSGEDLHHEFIKDLHELREVQADRKEITTYGFLAGVFNTGTVEVLTVFTPQKVREQVEKILPLADRVSPATILATIGVVTAGGAIGAAIARSSATKPVNEVYDRLQNRIKNNEMLHQNTGEGVRKVVNRMLQTHVILVKSGETPKVIFKPLNWFQRLVIKAQKTRVGKTGLIPARRRLGTSARN